MSLYKPSKDNYFLRPSNKTKYYALQHENGIPRRHAKDIKMPVTSKQIVNKSLSPNIVKLPIISQGNNRDSFHSMYAQQIETSKKKMQLSNLTSVTENSLNTRFHLKLQSSHLFKPEKITRIRSHSVHQPTKKIEPPLLEDSSSSNSFIKENLNFPFLEQALKQFEGNVEMFEQREKYLLHSPNSHNIQQKINDQSANIQFNQQNYDFQGNLDTLEPIPSPSFSYRPHKASFKDKVIPRQQFKLKIDNYFGDHIISKYHKYD